MKTFKGPPADDAEVRTVVERAFGPEAAENLRWGAAVLDHSLVAGATALLCRVEPVPQHHGWSLILKIIHHGSAHERWPASDDPADPMFWRREALFYNSEILTSFRGGLRAPRCYSIVDRDDGRTAIWLEDVKGEPAARWPVERYGIAARHLGRMQGNFLMRELPNENWLSRGWLRAYVARRGPDMAAFLETSVDDSPLTRATVSKGLVAEVVRVWNERERFLGAIERAPQTLCHLDFWPRNLFSQADETVAIDWAYGGVGRAGEDLGNFPAALLDMIVGVDHIKELEKQMWTGYVMGLRDAGWMGDVSVIRLAFTASAAVKYPWILPRTITIARQPDVRKRFEHSFGASIEEILRARVAVLEHLISLADEARALMEAV